jgi:hypothetical protein
VYVILYTKYAFNFILVSLCERALKDNSRIIYTSRMPLSVCIDLGVSVTLSLTRETIDTIKSLFTGHRVFIHGIDSRPIDYHERSECFDKGILDLFSNSTNEKKFKNKLALIAECRRDSDVICLRRKKEYVVASASDQTNYKRHVMDDDEDAEYTPFDLADIRFEFFDHISSLNADFENDCKESYDTVGGAYLFIATIQSSINKFKQLGFDEDQIRISNYNVSNT